MRQPHLNDCASTLNQNYFIHQNAKQKICRNLSWSINLLGLFLFVLFFPALTFSQENSDYVRVDGTQFILNDRTVRLVSANYWQAAHVELQTRHSDPQRLAREFRRLRRMGINHIRILGLSQGPNTEPWRITPASYSCPDLSCANQDLFRSLDTVLALAKRNHIWVTIILNNFWPWSGGMAQYLSWATDSSIPYPPPAENGDWNTYQQYTQEFYSNEMAIETWHRHVEALIKRKNSITAIDYKDDPTIFSWEMANEPRGFHNTSAFQNWIENSSTYIKQLGIKQLLTLGSEGDTPAPAWNGNDFLADHNHANIDYTTIHLWPENWDWFDPTRIHQTWPRAVQLSQDYLQRHLSYAYSLNKPIVLEEFGLARDMRAITADSATTARDQFFRWIYGQLDTPFPFQGIGFWAWAGESRPIANEFYWRPGNPILGDPPHELQGWYSVYDSDASTIAVIQRFSQDWLGNVTIQ